MFDHFSIIYEMTTTSNITRFRCISKQYRVHFLLKWPWYARYEFWNRCGTEITRRSVIISASHAFMILNTWVKFKSMNQTDVFTREIGSLSSVRIGSFERLASKHCSKNDSFKALCKSVIADISARHIIVISVQIKRQIHFAVQTTYFSLSLLHVFWLYLKGVPWAQVNVTCSYDSTYKK